VDPSEENGDELIKKRPRWRRVLKDVLLAFVSSLLGEIILPALAIVAVYLLWTKGCIGTRH